MLKLSGENPVQATSIKRPMQAPPAVPADMRVSNLLRLLGELRKADSLSRSDLARQTGLGIPTVHRLIHELVAADLVVEIPAVQDSSLKGRPAVMYRLLERGVLVAGVDVGNETTRFAVASASGHILASRTKPTSRLQRQLVEGIAEEIEQLLAEVGATGPISPESGSASPQSWTL